MLLSHDLAWPIEVMNHMPLKLKSFTNVNHLNLPSQARLSSLQSEGSTDSLYCGLNEDAVSYLHSVQEKGLAAILRLREPDLPEWGWTPVHGGLQKGFLQLRTMFSLKNKTKQNCF